MRVKTTLVAAALAGLTMMLLSGTAAADVIKVSPGDSIQAAINKAEQGDTVKVAPGTYQENVQIKTDGIKLKGAGADKTVLEPGTGSGSVDPVCSGGGGSVDGICVTDSTAPTDPNAPPTINHRVADVQIKDLTVHNFTTGAGVFFFGTENQRVSGVVAENNAAYGIVGFDTTGGQYWGNTTTGNGEAGIYIGDSPDANAIVRDNVSNANKGNGIFVRDASHGVVEDNQVSDNCIGILFLNTGHGTGNSDWTADGNTANHNNNACPAGDGPPSSGIGIAILGATNITLNKNETDDNKASGPSAGSAGIVVLSGAQIADDITIKDNSAHGNSLDIFWDQKGDNEFKNNRCDTSDPTGLCARSGGDNGGNEGGEGHGDHDNGGNGDGHHGKHHKHHKHHEHHGKHNND